jgi:hypothetical protein
MLIHTFTHSLKHQLLRAAPGKAGYEI